MRQSKLFTKTRKEAPTDEQAKNAQLLIRAGFVHKEMAGVYSFLPLGLRTLNKIIQIVREEMDSIGGQELKLTGLQDPTVWKKTGRWDSKEVDVWFKTQLQNKTEIGLGFTHEEPMTRMMADSISSYKNLPQMVYQFQTKFRNEVRAKSGIMRTREFIMKDMYTFASTQEEHDTLYSSIAKAYTRIYNQLGLGDDTYKTFASGGVFSKYSHEYQTLTNAGEDIIYLNRESGLAINKEVFNDEVLNDLNATREMFEEVTASEVGNIFSLGTKFSEPLKLQFKNKAGETTPVIMGSYGFGPARVMGVIVEKFADDKGMIWPESVAPFAVHLIGIGDTEPADELYRELEKKGIEVLYDDRDARPGQKFADADLIGIPLRVVISPKTVEAGGIEVKKRTENDAKIVTKQELFAML